MSQILDDAAPRRERDGGGDELLEIKSVNPYLANFRSSPGVKLKTSLGARIFVF